MQCRLETAQQKAADMRADETKIDVLKRKLELAEQRGRASAEQRRADAGERGAAGAPAPHALVRRVLERLRWCGDAYASLTSAHAACAPAGPRSAASVSTCAAMLRASLAAMETVVRQRKTMVNCVRLRLRPLHATNECRARSGGVLGHVAAACACSCLQVA